MSVIDPFGFFSSRRAVVSYWRRTNAVTTEWDRIVAETFYLLGILDFVYNKIISFFMREVGGVSFVEVSDTSACRTWEYLVAYYTDASTLVA